MDHGLEQRHFPADLIARCSPAVVLEIGVGAGFDAARFCSIGTRYTGIDRSAAAVAVASDRLAQSGSVGAIREADFFQFTPAETPDLIFDRGVFHNQRTNVEGDTFVARCAQLLKDRSHWISVIGSADCSTQTPHGAMRLSSLIPIVERYFEIETLDKRPYGPDDWPDNFDAWYGLFRKR